MIQNDNAISKVTQFWPAYKATKFSLFDSWLQNRAYLLLDICCCVVLFFLWCVMCVLCVYCVVVLWVCVGYWVCGLQLRALFSGPIRRKPYYPIWWAGLMAILITEGQLYGTSHWQNWLHEAWKQIIKKTCKCLKKDDVLLKMLRKRHDRCFG